MVTASQLITHQYSAGICHNLYLLSLSAPLGGTSTRVRRAEVMFVDIKYVAEAMQ